MITATGDSTFQTEVLDNEGVVIVDFWAPWCGPCRMVAPIVEELSEDYADKITFFNLNTDENQQAPRKYGIRSIPSLLVFKNGTLVETIVGFRPKNDLTKRIDTLLAE